MDFTPSLQPTFHMPLESRILFVYATSFVIFFLLLCLLLSLCIRAIWINLKPKKSERSSGEAAEEEAPPPPFAEAVRQLPRRGSELFVLMEDDLPPPYNLAINSK
jgi:hypothetical protein